MGYADVTSDRRTSKGNLDFEHDQTGLTAQTTSAGDTVLFPREPSGQLIGMIDPDSGNDLYYLFDRLGSVAATIDPTGTIDTTYDYEPYGEQINADPTDTNPHRYAGGYLDTDTGLIKFGTRYYMPDLARWTQPDPVLGNFSEPFSLDPYQYVRADPINAIDMTGRHWERYMAEYSWWASTTAICGAFGVGVGSATFAVGGIVAGFACDEAFGAIEDTYVRPALDEQYGDGFSLLDVPTGVSDILEWAVA